MNIRITPYITELKENEIFVFGSNESGFHRKGAAKQAMKFGARYGQAEGLQGKSYGIPTKNKKITNKLSISKIEKYVNNFIEFAKQNKQFNFLVTEIGCGLAGYTILDIAPLFNKALDLQNIWLPKKFIEFILVERNKNKI